MRILKCELSFCKYSTESSLYIGCQSIFNIIFKNLSTRDFTRNFKEIGQFFKKIAKKKKKIVFYKIHFDGNDFKRFKNQQFPGN